MHQGLPGLFRVFSRGIGLKILLSFLPPVAVAWAFFILYLYMVDEYSPGLFLPALGLGLAGIAAGSLIVLALVMTTVPAIRRLIDITNALAEGALSVDIPFLGRKDEIGELARSMNVFKGNAQHLRLLQAKEEAQSRRNQRKLQSQWLALNHALDEEVSASVADLLEMARHMSDSAGAVSQTVSCAADHSQGALKASDQAKQNVEGLALAVAALERSVNEIREEAARSTSIAGNATQEAERAGHLVENLSSAASNIGEVVSLISGIAAQTNLLALNATIEAARAGEAGKGFAVVAGEVKNLANQTAKATEDITNQVSKIQGVTQDAVSAIGSIGRIIAEVNAIAADIADAVARQHAATNEIDGNSRQTAQGTHDALGNIAQAVEFANKSGEMAAKVKEVSQGVNAKLEAMNQRFQSIMQANSDRNRHLNERHTLNVVAKLLSHDRHSICLLHEISLSGAAILDRIVDDVSVASEIELALEGIQPLRGTVMAITGRNMHIGLEIDDEDLQHVERFIQAHKPAA